MKIHEIRLFLHGINEWILGHPGLDHIRSELPPDVLKSHWLGSPPATDQDIFAAEARLDVQLPPSCKDFLSVSNGFLRLSPILGPLLSTTELAWFRETHQEIIDAWVEDNQDNQISDDEYLVYGPEQWKSRTRFGYLQNALCITKPGDPTILLNPDVIFPDGEWEVWSFGTVHAGARRFQSLGAALLAHILDTVLWM